MDSITREIVRPQVPAPLLPATRSAIASDAATERARIIDACRAELAWATRRYRLSCAGVFTHRPFDHELEQDAAAHRMPHEKAAAVVLGCWGHLHPIEWRIRACILRLRAQRANGWHANALGTINDIRAYWLQRRAVSKAFHRAVKAYQAARAEV